MPDSSYEDHTVAELKEELEDRGLPTSGHKDELIARLEEDDEATEAEDEATETSVEVGVLASEVPEGDPYKTVYNPYELPADPVAAQAFIDAHPESVDENVPMSQERQDQATVNIADSMAMHADAGTPVSDPRVPGGTDPIPDPSLTAVYPESSVVGPPDDVLLTVVGANFLITTQIGFGVISQEAEDAGLGTAGDPKWENTTFVNGTTLTTVITADLFPNPDPAVPVVVGEPGGTASSALTFAFEDVAPPDEGEAKTKTKTPEPAQR